MKIILEGPDGTGKTTLAHIIGFPYYHSGPRPDDIIEAVTSQAVVIRAHKNIVLDRVTPISDWAYDNRLQLEDAIALFKQLRADVVIYCNTQHPVESSDGFKKSDVNISEVQKKYDIFFNIVNHLTYDWRSDDEPARILKTLQEIANSTDRKWNKRANTRDDQLDAIRANFATFQSKKTQH